MQLFNSSLNYGASRLKTVDMCGLRIQWGVISFNLMYAFPRLTIELLIYFILNENVSDIL